MKSYNDIFSHELDLNFIDTVLYKNLIESDIDKQITEIMEEKGKTIKGVNLAKD